MKNPSFELKNGDLLFSVGASIAAKLPPQKLENLIRNVIIFRFPTRRRILFSSSGAFSFSATIKGMSHKKRRMEKSGRSDKSWTKTSLFFCES